MNIYIGNLDYKVTEDDLKSIFENYGTVNSANIITDKYTGKSKGFGFISMENDAEGKKAIDKLNGSTIENRKILVNVAKPRKENY